MRTFALLAALLLLALQAQARTLQETADQVSAQNQPEAKNQGELWSEDQDQDQAGDGDQDVAISFTGEERLSRAAGLRKPIVCTCRSGRCYSGELLSGSCRIDGLIYNLCCK